MLQWKYKKTEYFKTAKKFSTPSSESTVALAKRIFNMGQLLYHLTLPKFTPARSSVWQLQPNCWEERGSTFRFTGAGVEQKASEIFTATVLSSRAMPVAANTQWWPTRKPQKTIPVVKTVSPQQNEKQGFKVQEKMMMHLPVWKFLGQN